MPKIFNIDDVEDYQKDRKTDWIRIPSPNGKPGLVIQKRRLETKVEKLIKQGKIHLRITDSQSQTRKKFLRDLYYQITGDDD